MAVINANLSNILGPLFSERAILLSERDARALISKAANLMKDQASASEAARQWNKDGIAKFQPQSGGIAVIPVYGILTKQAQWYDDWIGCCSAERLNDQLAAAMADDSIEDIVLDIDSPGGFVNGPVEFADSIAKANEVKTVTAVIRGMCCSGAYWLASQCETIISRRECEVGNIGVYTVLADVSKFYSDMGVDLTVVASGQFKGMGADGKVNEDLLSDTKRIVNGLFQQFVSAVAAGRDMTIEQAMEVSDGRAYLGAQAQKLGLIDQIVTSFDEAMRSIVGARPQESSTMSKTNEIAADPKVIVEDDAKAAPSGMAAFVEGISGAAAFKAGTKTTVTVEAAPSTAKKKDEDEKSDDEEMSKKDGDEEDDCDKKDDEMDKKEKKGGKKKGESAAAASAGTPSAFTPADYIAAFGDIGARWFYEGKAYQACTIEFSEKLKAEHKAQEATLQMSIDALSAKLALVDRGNDPASSSYDKGASPDQKSGQTAVTQDLINKVGSKGMAAYVAGISDSPAFKSAGKSRRN